MAQAGGTAVEFGVMAACDGIANRHTAMKLLYGRGLALKTALVTDGRFSGTKRDTWRSMRG